ncbi:MAG TPA: Uma2 family endonuclease [Micromonosporaceae bacterium]|jgi:Uma2 family endonuclease
MSAPALSATGPWTLDDWWALNESSAGSRYELIDGGLLVSPPPTYAHQWAGDALCRVLLAAAKPDFRVATAVGVTLADGDSALIPDIVVARREPMLAPTIPIALVSLVVEIVSPSSRVTDRRSKPAIFAAAGVPHFWRVELLPFTDQGSDVLPVLFAYALDGGEYRLTHRVGAGTRAALTEPFPVAVDPAELIDD